MHKIFLVIPAYNEEDNIVDVIGKIINTGKDYQIVVVDDCSQDNTFERASNSGAYVLRHLLNRGQGAALKTGTEYAIIKGADIIVHFDADGQFIPSEIADIIAPILRQEADVVFGSRFMSRRSNMPWLKRMLMMPMARLVNFIFFNIKLSDPQAGFRAFSSKAYKKLEWQQDRMAHCSEIMRNAFNNKLSVKETPITVIYKDFGQKFSGGLKILKDMFLGRFTKKNF